MVIIMISATRIYTAGDYQLNLVECKDQHGFVVRFHFEITNRRNGKCIGIYDQLDKARLGMDDLTQASILNAG